MMKAHVEWVAGTDTYAVHLIDSGFRKAVGRIEGDRIVYDTVEDGATAEPALRISDQEVKALAEALCDIPQATSATVTHLADACTVRDRLLSMIEKQQTPQPTRKNPND